MKRNFEQVLEAANRCIQTLTGYEKCLLHNKLLVARSNMSKYENLIVAHEAQLSMAKLDVEIATSDIDLLLQELQRGKRFKTGEAVPTMSIFTQTGSHPTSSPVSDTSRISFDLPSVDLRSSSKNQEPNAQRENAPESGVSHGENVEELTTSLRDNAQNSTTSQSSKDSGYNSSAKSLLISQETTIKKNLLPKNVVSEEILADLPPDNTKGDAKIVKSTKKYKTKKKAYETKDQPIISKKMSNEKTGSTEGILLHKQTETKNKPTDEKTKINKEVVCIKDKTQEIYNTIRKSEQRRHSQDNTHRKKDERKCDSYNRQTNNRNSSDNNKGDKKHRDYKHKIEKKTDQAPNKPKRPHKAWPAQKSNLHKRENTDPRIQNNNTINESDAVNSKTPKDISCDTTLVIAEEAMDVEMTIPNPRIEDFAKDPPIHYKDFEKTILSSVTDALNTTRNTVDSENFQGTVAQSTPFVRRIRTVEHSGSDYQDFSSKVCIDALIEDQLTTFIRTTLADYNRDLAELCTSGDKTTKINEENTSEHNVNVENTKTNEQTTKINKINSRETDGKSKTPEKTTIITTKENLMVKIPVNKVPATMNQISAKVKQPCLTVSVNDAGVITIRPRSAENSNLPSPKPGKTAVNTDRQQTQDKNINSTTISNLKEPTINTSKQIPRGQDILPQTPVKNTARNPKPVEIETETASYMTQLKDQYYFDVNSPKLADEAPTHKNAVSLFRAFSLLMPPSPTFTVSSSSDKENCSNTPSPPKAQKLPINKELLDDFVPRTFNSNKNYTTTGFKKDVTTSYRNKNLISRKNYNTTSSRNNIPNYIHRNDPIKYGNEISTNYKNNINTRCRNDIPIRRKNDIHVSYRNDNRTSFRNDSPRSCKNVSISHGNNINTHYKNNIPTSYRNDNPNNPCNNKKPMQIRRTKSISETTSRRTIKFTEAQPLPVLKPKSTTTPKPKINRRKSLDDRAILRILNEPCSSISSKSASPKSMAPTLKKKGLSLFDYFALHDIW